MTCGLTRIFYRKKNIARGNIQIIKISLLYRPIYKLIFYYNVSEKGKKPLFASTIISSVFKQY